MTSILFPLRKRPVYSYKTEARNFGAWRSGGRLHAGCDLLADRGTEILAIENGTIIQGPYYFYSSTYALEVKHDSGIVVRYGEILQTVPRGISPGARVSKGQVIAYVGLLDSGSSMLHFEMYKGTANGELTTGTGPYRRRSDLIDPTPFLDAALVGTPKPLQPGEARANDHVSSVLNLRSQPNPDASLVTTLSPGTVAKLVRSVTGGGYSAEGSTRNDWFELETSGQSGFAAGYYVEVGKDYSQHSGDAGTSGAAKVNNNVTSTLNLRSEADARSVVVTTLSPGMMVNIVAKVNGHDYMADGVTRNDWYKLTSGPFTGFAAGYYLDVNAHIDNTPIPNALGRVNSGVTSVLNVREKPELAANILFTLSPEQTFEILKSVTGDTYAGGRNDWLNIRHGNGTGYAAGLYISVNQQATPKSKWDSILPNVPTSGASARTAAQDGLPPGIAASEAMAQRDLERVKKIANTLLSASAKFGIPAALLAAEAGRESRAGGALDPDGWGDNHIGFGILQVDKNSHRIGGSESPTSQAHVDQATGILAGYIDAVQDLHPDWDDIYILKGAVAAYNCGPSNVRTIEAMDIGTTGDDYSSDVIARAKYYLKHVELPMFRQ
jgi:SH3-like domain-containing protein